MDGYDKLKPYGIAISGCIDGFSRFIVWMEAFTTNNDPRVIPDYFVSSAERLGGCPERLRADRGTENGHVEIKVDMMFQLDSRRFELNVDMWTLKSTCRFYGKNITARQKYFFSSRVALILRRNRVKL